MRVQRIGRSPNDQAFKSGDGSAFLQDAFGILGENVELDVDRIVDDQLTEIGFFQRVGNDPNGQRLVAEFSHGEADSVDGDGTFPSHVVGKLPGDSDLEFEVISARIGFEHRSHGIDMALDKVTAEAGIGSKSTLEIDWSALAEVAEVGSEERFLEEIEDELIPTM